MIRFLAITLIILAETLYNKYCPGIDLELNVPGFELTNWSVFYFSICYISIAILCLEGAIKEFHTFFKIAFTVYGFFFVYLAVIDLTKIGMPYDKYLQSITDRFANSMLHFFLISSLVLTCIEIWFRYAKNKHHVNRLN